GDCSKIGSFTDHKPAGGNVQIFSETRTYNVQPKVGSLNNVTHTPGGGNVKIPSMKLDFKERQKPKIDAKSEYVPPVPEKKAETLTPTEWRLYPAALGQKVFGVLAMRAAVSYDGSI
ncbi:Tau and MAP protein, tubulin-binding repeat protein, partial [Cooperia oncophora]